MRDFHLHSNYSDGAFLRSMVRAAESTGLDGIGFADHCNVGSRERMRTARSIYGFNLDLTYRRRRKAIEVLRADTSIEIYDAVEMDYNPREEADIRIFLEEATFDYAIGSVHGIDGDNLQVASNFVEMTDAERDAIVDRYFDTLVSLAESELFDIAAHIDLIERTAPLRGRATNDQYRRVARAFADSRTIVELNAGRATTKEGIVHPSEQFVSILREYDVPLTIGSDAHDPSEIEARIEFLEDYISTRGIEPAAPQGLGM